MSDPSFDLQAALNAILRADIDLSEYIAARVYDTVPAVAEFPYLSFGDFQVLADRADCIDGAATTVTIHAWSRSKKQGSGELKKITDLVVRLLDQQIPDLGDVHAVVTFDHESTRYLSDPDGLTRHAVMTFNVLTDAVG